MIKEKAFTRHSRNFWEAQITAWRSSGISMNEYCRKNNLSQKSLSHWKRKLKQSGQKAGGQPFVEINYGEVEPGHDDRTIEMIIGTTRLVMREGIDPLQLRDIALALGGI